MLLWSTYDVVYVMKGENEPDMGSKATYAVWVGGARTVRVQSRFAPQH